MKEFINHVISSFLSSKNAPKYFVVKARYSEEAEEEQDGLSVLTDADVAAIRGLKEKYGTDYAKHLSEYFEDEDAIHDLAPGGEILDIKVEDGFYYQIRFTAGIFKDDKVMSYPLALMLPEAAYARLVEICFVEENITFNTVFRFGEGLAQLLYKAVESALREDFTQSDIDKYPFFITMDEAKDDARKIKDIILNFPSKEGSNPAIWRLTEASETDKLFAHLDYATFTDCINIMFSRGDEEERAMGSGSPSVEEKEERAGGMFLYFLRQIKWEDEWNLNIDPYELGPVAINTLLDNGEVLIDSRDLELKKGDIVYEAAIRSNLGAEQAYALAPLGYFTQKINHPALEGAEWIERKLL